MTFDQGHDAAGRTSETPEDTATDHATPKRRLPLIDDEYPMLIDRDEEG